MSCEVSEIRRQRAGEPQERPGPCCAGRSKASPRAGVLGLVLLPALLAIAVFYAPWKRGASAWDLHGDAKLYAYQLARAPEVGGRWWQLADDPWVGRPYQSFVAKHPGIYEGLDLLLLSSFTGRWLTPAANLHLMVLIVLAFNGWVAAWITYRLTRRLFWAAMATVLITLNVSTAIRFYAHPHLIKYGWVLLAVWAMWCVLEQPSVRRGVWLGLAVALVVQSSFYYGFLLTLALGGWWLLSLAARQLERPHWVAAGVGGLTAAAAGAALTAPVWLVSRHTLLADDYFRHQRFETWLHGSQLWHYCISPAWRCSREFLDAVVPLHFVSPEGWHYLGVMVLSALALYGFGRLRGWRLDVPQPWCLHMLLGLMGLLILLSLAGGPSAILFSFFRGIRCYGRAGGLAMALGAVAAPVIWQALTASLAPRWRATVCVALLAALGYDDYRLAKWSLDGPWLAHEEQHPAWANWLAEQPHDVRAAVFATRINEPWEVTWHWDALDQRFLHHHATLNGGEFVLLDADLRQLGCSFFKINADGLRFVVSLGYETLVFHRDYLRDNAWIENLAWLDNVTTAGEWRVFRANDQTPRFPTVTLPELLAHQPQCPPTRVPVGATLTDSLPLAEPVVVGEGPPIRLAWATPQGDRIGKEVPAFFQHLLGPQWPAYHIETPRELGTYQLQFLAADGRLLGASLYQVDAELQTACGTLPQRPWTIKTLILGTADRPGPVRLRIENTTPYYVESHQLDRHQKSLTRYHVGFSWPGFGAFRLAIRAVPSQGGPEAANAAAPLGDVALPHDLPPYGHLELEISPSWPADANAQTGLEVQGVFHSARWLTAGTPADVQLERANPVRHETTAKVD